MPHFFFPLQKYPEKLVLILLVIFQTWFLGLMVSYLSYFSRKRRLEEEIQTNRRRTNMGKKFAATPPAKIDIYSYYDQVQNSW